MEQGIKSPSGGCCCKVVIQSNSINTEENDIGPKYPKPIIIAKDGPWEEPSDDKEEIVDLII